LVHPPLLKKGKRGDDGDANPDKRSPAREGEKGKKQHGGYLYQYVKKRKKGEIQDVARKKNAAQKEKKKGGEGNAGSAHGLLDKKKKKTVLQ